jgi:hypothetical protein
VDPRQVTVLEQDPSVLTAFAPDEVELGAVDVLVEVDDFVEEDETDPPLELLYQLAGSSPRQVPTVTDLKPWEYIEARM